MIFWEGYKWAHLCEVLVCVIYLLNTDRHKKGRKTITVIRVTLLSTCVSPYQIDKIRFQLPKYRFIQEAGQYSKQSLHLADLQEMRQRIRMFSGAQCITLTWSGNLKCSVSICWENFHHDLNFSTVNIWANWRNYPKSSSLSELMTKVLCAAPLCRSLWRLSSSSSLSLLWHLPELARTGNSSSGPRRLPPLSSWSPETRRWHWQLLWRNALRTFRDSHPGTPIIKLSLTNIRLNILLSIVIILPDVFDLVS